MANVTAGTAFPLLMHEISLSNLWNGTITEVTASRITVAFGGGDYVEFGGAFNFDSQGGLAGGQLTSVTEVRDGREAYRVTDFAVPVSTFLTWVERDLTEAAKAHILGSADRISGSPFGDVLQGYDGDDLMLGGAGGDVLYGGNGSDDLQGGEGDDGLAPGFGGGQVDGGAGDDVIFHNEAYGTPQAMAYDFSGLAPSSNTSVMVSDGRGGLYAARNVEHVYVDGSQAGDRITGSQGADYLLGWGGNDVLVGGRGTDFIDGGLGIDTAAVGGFRRHFSADLAAGSAVSALAGMDTVVSVETMVFRDGVLTVDTASAAAQVFRLYQTTLDRAPDPEGLSNWMVALVSGAQSLQGVANAFVGSPEFTRRYGVLSDEQFVRLLYDNVLGREADGPGLANWLQYMAAGASRAQVVLGFSESLELIGATAATVQAGLWIQDPTATTLARLYDTALGRLPDSGGLASWLDALAGGTSIRQVTDAFMASAEFQSHYGQVGNEDFVELLYRNALDREPDAPGLEGWTRALEDGLSRAELVLAFSESQEHKSLTAGQVDGGLWFA